MSSGKNIFNVISGIMPVELRYFFLPLNKMLQAVILIR